MCFFNRKPKTSAGITAMISFQVKPWAFEVEKFFAVQYEHGKIAAS
jgi:hypothetical protein